MKETLQQQGWICKPCNCPGKKFDECAHKDFRGVIIKLITANNFRIFRNGLVITSGFAYQLAAKLKENELLKESV